MYTPIKSITTGRHFLTYDSLHLTEMAQSFDYGQHSDTPQGLCKGYATNNEHDAVPHQISWMLLALPHVCTSRVFHLHPILTLMHMVHGFAIKAEASRKEGIDKALRIAAYLHQNPQLSLQDLASLVMMGQSRNEEDVAGNDHLHADRVRQVIVDKLGLTWVAVAANPEEFKGDWRDLGPTVELEFLEQIL
jgi:hypothetical protein